MSLNRLFRCGLRENLSELSAALMISLIIGAAFLGLTVIINAITDRVLIGQSAIDQVVLLLLLWGGMLISLSAARALLIQRVFARLVMAQQTALLEHLLSVPLDVIRMHDRDALANSVVTFTETTLTFALRFSTRVVELLPLGVILWRWSLPVVIAVSAVMIPLWIVTFRRTRARYNLEGQLTRSAVTLIHGVGKLRTLHAVDHVRDQWSALYCRYDRLHVVQSLILPLLAVVPVLLLVGWIERGIGAALGVGLFAVGLVGGLQQITQFISELPRYTAMLTAIREASAQESGERAQITGSIDVEDIVFRYHAQAAPILDHVRVHIAPGEHVALVGVSGAGKSTLIKLLIGIERPESGSICFDGMDIKRISNLREQMGIVLQHSRLSAGSLRANINGFTRRPIEATWRAARLAQIADVIEGLTMNLHTLIDEDAKILSRGQVQRLLIARSLVHEPPLLIFDEATSALDDETQTAVFAQLRPYTLLYTTHRLSALRHADRILVLDHGRIVEQGTLDSLIAQGGVFAARILPSIT